MMRKGCSKLTALFSLLMLCLFAAGCGCGKKNEKDPAEQQVLKITITPEATPTPQPSEVNADAVVTNGNITMVNGYLVEESGTSGRKVDNTEKETESAAGESGEETDEGSTDETHTGEDAEDIPEESSEE